MLFLTPWHLAQSSPFWIVCHAGATTVMFSWQKSYRRERWRSKIFLKVSGCPIPTVFLGTGAIFQRDWGNLLERINKKTRDVWGNAFHLSRTKLCQMLDKWILCWILYLYLLAVYMYTANIYIYILYLMVVLAARSSMLPTPLSPNIPLVRPLFSWQGSWGPQCCSDNVQEEQFCPIISLLQWFIKLATVTQLWQRDSPYKWLKINKLWSFLKIRNHSWKGKLDPNTLLWARENRSAVLYIMGEAP